MHNHTNLSVCRSAAGYYVGIWCPECGPYSRNSGYMSEEMAQAMLAEWTADEEEDALPYSCRNCGEPNTVSYEDCICDECADLFEWEERQA